MLSSGMTEVTKHPQGGGGVRVRGGEAGGRVRAEVGNTDTGLFTRVLGLGHHTLK